MTGHDRLVDLVADLDEEGAVARVRERLAAGEVPSRIIEDCQAGLVLVGDRYEQGDYFIAGLVMAGEIFRETMVILEPLVAGSDARPEAGRVLICTVHGDIHDLGKNLVATLLRAQGFAVVDLGVDVSPAEVVQAFEDVGPDVVALSAMLTTAVPGMRDTVTAVRAAAERLGVPAPVIVGGAQMNAETAAWVGADRWSTNAGEGARLIRELVAETRLGG
jgi:methanogenic corrinoid protein MtbC1